MSRTTPALVAALTLGAAPLGASAVPYQVLMDDVVSGNWAPMHDGVGDLYDGASVKQVDVSYTERVDWGNSNINDDDPQF